MRAKTLDLRPTVRPVLVCERERWDVPLVRTKVLYVELEDSRGDEEPFIGRNMHDGVPNRSWTCRGDWL